MNTATKISNAVEKLTVESEPSGSFFTYWASAKEVAKEAGVSETTARKYMEMFVRNRNLRKQKINGTAGYRPYVYS